MTLIKGLGCQMLSEDIAITHKTFMKSVGIELSDNDKENLDQNALLS